MRKKKYRFWIKKDGVDRLKKAAQKVKLAATIAVTYLMITIPVYADTPDYTKQKFFTGTKKLFAAGTAILTALAAGATGFFVGKAFLAWQAAGEDEKARKFKTIWVTLAAGVGVTVSSGLATYVLGFYS